MKQTASMYRLTALNPLLRRRQWSWRTVAFIAIAIVATLLVAMLNPRQVLAYDVAIQPASPQQGDTVSIFVTANAGATQVPTVTVNGEIYPTFAIGGDRYRTFVPSSPLHNPGRYVIQVTGAEPPRNPAFWLDRRSFQVQRITLSASAAGIEGTDHEFDRVQAFKDTLSPTKYWTGPFQRPSQGRVSSEYGVRRYYNGVFADDYYHRGIDYAAATGSPVVAPAAGRVTLVGRVANGFELHGNTIGIDHGQGVGSIFIHLNSIAVNEGDMVQAGQTIGTIGSTGASTGPHLHWGVYVNGVAVDPGPWRNGGME
ncbi:MAG: M23 family metallopeptidase [Cyanobacteria bacterium]|nr:M23 family metallopeptidase [Cyanobacteriota bacterium]